MVQVTTPMGWAAFLIIALLILTAVFWGIWGIVPTRIKGEGILIKTGGVYDVCSMESGQITAIYAHAGEIIDKGQVVARLAQLDLIEEIKVIKTKLSELKNERQKILAFETEDIKMQKEHMANQRKRLEASIEYDETRLRWLKEKLADQEWLLKSGIIVRKDYIETQESINAVHEETKKKQNDLKQLSIEEFQLENKKKREIRGADQKIKQTEMELNQALNKFENSSKVLSPYTGRILEIVKKEGETVVPGAPILNLEGVGGRVKDLEAVLYMPASEGKKVQLGMKVQIYPSTVKQEEYGFMVGMVTRVAEFPSTRLGMMRILQNENLVEELSAGGSLIEVFSDLIPDPRTESEYKWSSSRGPAEKIQSGTLCSASITVFEQSPASLVVPLLKKHFLGIGQKRFNAKKATN